MLLFWLALLLGTSEIHTAPSIRSSSTGEQSSVGIQNDLEEAERILVNIDQQLNSFVIKLKSEDASPLGVLDLQPAPFPFAPGFSLKHADVDDKGDLTFEEDPIFSTDIDLLDRIANNTFIDPKSDAVFRVKRHPSSDEFTLEGLFKDQRISWEESGASIRHFLHTDKLKKKRQSEGDSPPIHEQDDAIDEHRPLISGRAPPGMNVAAAPDLVFLLDFENSKLFNWNTEKILDYASIFVNAVNTRFSTNVDPKITFTLAGIVTTKSKDVEKHFEKAKGLTGGHYESSKLLEAFSYWAFENKKDLGKYDILPILTAVPFEGQTAGVAYVESACWNQKSATEKRDMSVALIHDAGGIWQAAATVAHELAHSLGVPHDGSGKSSGCAWSEGYMMSYEGWGTPNKFKFSTCSQKAMREFIISSGGFCLNVNSGLKSLLSSSDALGMRMSMETMCKKVTNKADAVLMDDDADAQCRMLKCKYSAGAPGSYNIASIQTMIGDDAPCGKGGKCKEGFCVGNQQKPIQTQEEKDNICKEKMANQIAVSIDTSDFPPDRQCTSLKCKVSTGNGGYSWQQVDVFLGNGVSCKKSGTCKGGKCVLFK